MKNPDETAMIRTPTPMRMAQITRKTVFVIAAAPSRNRRELFSLNLHHPTAACGRRQLNSLVKMNVGGAG